MTISARLITQLRAAGCVFAEEEAALLTDGSPSPDELEAMVRRRAGGEPIEHVVGWAAFAGLRLVVGPGAFVPRRRSELLAREAIARTEPGSVVVDLCCGVGGLGAAILVAVPNIELHAADIEPAAVHCARRNLDGRATVHEGDLYDALPADLAGRIDVIVANAPYVPTHALDLMPAEARLHEPTRALDGGDDGLAVHRRIALDARRWLRPGGHLLIEVTDEQVPVARQFLAGAGLVVTVAHDDDLEATVLIAAA
jgi:release factor glutamine methyltransferase